MPVREIVKFGDPRLRSVAQNVDVTSDAWRQDAIDLLDTLDEAQRRLGFGRALAGPQIGSVHRMIAFDCDLGRFVGVNPEITWASVEQRRIWDDCFSLPGTCIGVRRAASISFRCLDQECQPRTFNELDFTLAELVQHEIDHLDGILMIDHLISPFAIISSELAPTLSVDAF